MAASVYGAETPVDTADSERTSFRRAEKKYKLYKSLLPKSRSNSSIHLSANPISLLNQAPKLD